MADKKLNGTQFVEELRKKAKYTNLRNCNFVIVGQKVEENVEDTSIVLIEESTKRVLCAFSYDTNGVIYNMSFGGISFTRLCDFTDLIKNILEDY